MGKLQVFEVLLAGGKVVYKPGDVIQGEARIVVSEEKRDIRGIHITCAGIAYTHWTESEGSGENRSSVSYYSEHVYFKEEVSVRGAGENNNTADRIVLTAGEHRFPFRFEIPNVSLPPPFEGVHGYMRYFVEVVIDRPWRFDHLAQVLFSIYTVKDLNKELNVLTPRSHQVEKTVCCLCCTSGPIILKAGVDKRGYVPGEYIFVSLKLHNDSSRRINTITVRLQQKGIYSAQRRGTGTTHHRESVQAVAELKLAGCGAMGSATYDRTRMLVPPVPPCLYDSCPIIKVEYFIQVQAHISGTCSDARVMIPILIGTIPAFPSRVKGPSPFTVQPVPGQPPSGQPGFPPPGQYGYPHPSQPGVLPPVQQDNIQPGQTLVPSQGQVGYLPGQPEVTVPEPNQAGYPLPGQLPIEEVFPPPPTYTTAVGGPQHIEGKKGSFGNIVFAPQYPCYDPDTLYTAMGIPQGASTSSENGAQPAPTVVQPSSIQQPPRQS